MALIELDLEAPPAPVSGRPPASSYRPLGLLVAVVLALTLGGAVPVAPTLWQRVGSVPLLGPDTSFSIDGNQLYTTGARDGDRVVTAWSVPSLKRLWESSVPLETVGVDSGSVQSAGRDLLLRSGASAATTVLDLRTGAVRWSSPASILPVAAGIAVVLETRFRSGTDYQIGTGDPGAVYWSSTGNPHTVPPERATLAAVDLDTGRVIWTTERPGALWAVAAPDDSVVVVSAGQMVRFAADTGRTLRVQTLPASDRVSNAQVLDGLLVVRYGDWNKTGTLVTYSLDTLEPRWRVADPPDGGARGSCFQLLCEQQPDSLAVLDPATGEPRWRVGAGVDLFGHGDAVLESKIISGEPVRLHDRGTGAVRAALNPWRLIPGGADPAPAVVVSRPEPGWTAVAFGAVRAGRGVVQPLGTAPAPATDCTSSGRYVTCRVGESVGVWTYSL